MGFIRYKPLMLKRIGIIMLLTAMLTGCVMPALPGFPTRPPTATFTPIATPTITPTPSPTPTPTPLPAARVELGDWAVFTGDYDRAMQEYQTALDNAGDAETQAAALTGMGRVDYLRGDCSLAIQALSTVAINYPQSHAAAVADYLMAQCYLAQNSPAEAATALNGYLVLRPATLDAFIQEARGDALNQAGDYTGAITAYEAAAAAPSLDDPVYVSLKIGRAYASMEDHTNALRTFLAIRESSNNDYVKAEANYLAGLSYLALGIPDQAYARFQDSVLNFPRSYYAYSGLVELVNAGIPVDDLDRGLVDYFAGQYALAVDAFTRYLASVPDHDATAHFYMGLSLNAIGQPEAAISAFDEVINNHPGDSKAAPAWDEKAYTYWYYLNDYSRGAQIWLDFVSINPGAPEAPQFLYYAARIFERNNQLAEAASTWERLMNEYASNELSYRALFLAGITRYRLGDTAAALTIFQRLLVLGVTPEDQAAAYLWIGKCQQVQGDTSASMGSWELAAQRDPTGYYSERARQLLSNQSPFQPVARINLEFDPAQEKSLAEGWLRTTFGLPAETDLSGLAELAYDPRVVRAGAFWELGLYEQASEELESVRLGITSDPAANYRLMNYALNLGLYRTAIFSSRQVLTLANLDDVGTFSAPSYFNHVRFGPYFKDTVLTTSNNQGLDPLLVFSAIRQESLFEGFRQSAAGAAGLMQLMPATGAEVAAQLGWPPGYTTADLYRPAINIPMGTYYLARQVNAFGGDLYLALAAYNGGPGNALSWQAASGGDPDLFLEVIHYDETRTYLRQIVEFYLIYQRLYGT